MPHINVLDIQVANLIAAGEVVDRPASAIKELLENSIDAGATNVTVEIKNGGATFMRVSDNGCGMEKDDLPTAIKRHATSKIKDASDLNAICTLGFRGEALAAIASVSKLRIISKTRDNQMGASLTVEDGEIKDLSEAGGSDGTTIIAEELFANVPARRKFLKNNKAEAMAVTAVVEKIALSHPEVAIKLISDGSPRFSTAGDGKLYSVIYSVLGREFAGRMLEIGYTTGGITVNGYVGEPDNNRGNRNFENFFINGRYVKSKTAAAALEAAFDSFIPSDKFPCAVLNIEIMPAFVDVNVHPAKLEVKFSNDRIVYDAVYCAVRNALTDKIDRPKLAFEATAKTVDDVKYMNAFVPVYDPVTETEGDPKPPEKLTETEPDLSAFAPVSNTQSEVKTAEPDVRVDFPKAKPAERERPERESGVPKKLDFMPEISNIITSDDITSKNNESLPNPPEAEPLPEPEPLPQLSSEPESFEASDDSLKTNGIRDTRPAVILPEYKIIGEAFNSYVFVELCGQDRLLAIDKHAAHERIIFEELKRSMQGGARVTQILLLPIHVPLEASEYSALADYYDEIISAGFDILLHDCDHSAEITGYPGEIEQSAAADMVTELARRLAEGTGSVGITREMIYEKALYQASCKAAIKAGRTYDSGHIRYVVEKLLSLPDIKFCPHGRPVAFEITRSSLEKQFGRT